MPLDGDAEPPAERSAVTAPAVMGSRPPARTWNEDEHAAQHARHAGEAGEGEQGAPPRTAGTASALQQAAPV